MEMADSVYEPAIAHAFRMPDAAHLSVQALDRASLAVTEIRLNRDGFGWTDPIPYADAFMLAVQFKGIPFHEAMTDGKPVPVYDIRPGDTLFYDMRRDPRANVNTRSHSLHFVLSQTLLDEIAGEIRSHRIGGLFPPTGAAVHDRQLARLAKSVLPAIRKPDEATDLFISHLTLTLGIYACWRYGGMQAPQQPKGELCGLQTRLAKEYIAAHLNGGIELSELARVCGMPARRFAMAFRDTLGMAPYQWLTIRRIDLGKSLLAKCRYSLDKIASLCGFADVVHFSRVFKEATSITPLKWRQIALH